MTFDEWTPLYGYLCAGLGRKEDGKQCRVYYDAVKLFPQTVVSEAMRSAVSKVWPQFHPVAGDLVDACTGVLRARAVPAARCDVCHGDLFTYTFCEGWKSGGQGQAPEPVNRQQLCRRDFPHAAHEQAHFCYQCHPASRTTEPAA